MKRIRLFACLTAVTLLLATLPVTRAQKDAAAIGSNVKLTLKIVDSDPGEGPALREYMMLARDGGGPARLLMGWRVPIPTRDSDVADDVPATEFTYQNIGVTMDVNVNIRGDGKIIVRGTIEASGVRQGPEGMRQKGLPIIGTFQQQLNVTLTEGAPLRVAEVPDPEGGKIHLELTAQVLD